MINYIFGFFLIVGIVYGSITGNINSINSVICSVGYEINDGKQ